MSEKATKKPTKKTIQVIAEGKSVTSKAGIKGSGDEVKVADFVSQEVFDNLVEKEFIVDKKVEV